MRNRKCGESRAAQHQDERDERQCKSRLLLRQPDHEDAEIGAGEGRQARHEALCFCLCRVAKNEKGHQQNDQRHRHRLPEHGDREDRIERRHVRLSQIGP